VSIPSDCVWVACDGARCDRDKELTTARFTSQAIRLGAQPVTWREMVENITRRYQTRP
jgi:hypothetical protein